MGGHSRERVPCRGARPCEATVAGEGPGPAQRRGTEATEHGAVSMVAATPGRGWEAARAGADWASGVPRPRPRGGSSGPRDGDVLLPAAPHAGEADAAQAPSCTP
jgi:hypothetical protein